MGFSSMEFLVLPRMLALVLMVPLLTVYATQMGLAGGAVISAGLLDVSVRVYFHQLQEALTLKAFAQGLIKSGVSGVIVALAGCLWGIQCGRSAEAVGAAATSAVVTGIVFIIVAFKVREFITRGEADVGTPEGGQQPCNFPWERGERGWASA
jgi:phospholipid/cholesterol/gamma-HCH transport system permease protein